MKKGEKYKKTNYGGFKFKSLIMIIYKGGLEKRSNLISADCFFYLSA
jgi:hypothetical protein